VTIHSSGYRKLERAVCKMCAGTRPVRQASAHTFTPTPTPFVHHACHTLHTRGASVCTHETSGNRLNGFSRCRNMANSDKICRRDTPHDCCACCCARISGRTSLNVPGESCREKRNSCFTVHSTIFPPPSFTAFQTIKPDVSELPYSTRKNGLPNIRNYHRSLSPVWRRGRIPPP
jgi:hypothetical protein